MARQRSSSFVDNLGRMYGMYTGLFIGFVILLGIGEALAKLPESKSNLVLAMRTGKGTATMDVVLPKVHAQEIMGAVQQVQAQMMQQSRPNGVRKSKGPMPDWIWWMP